MGVAVAAGTVVATAAAGTVVVVAEAAAGTAVTVVAGTVVAVVAGTVVAAAAAGTVVAAAAAGTVVAVAAAAGTVVAAVATAGIVVAAAAAVGIVVAAAAAVGIVVAAAAVGIVVASAAAAGCWTAVCSSPPPGVGVGSAVGRLDEVLNPPDISPASCSSIACLPESGSAMADSGFAAGAPPFCCLELTYLGCCSPSGILPSKTTSPSVHGLESGSSVSLVDRGDRQRHGSSVASPGASSVYPRKSIHNRVWPCAGSSPTVN